MAEVCRPLARCGRVFFSDSEPHQLSSSSPPPHPLHASYRRSRGRGSGDGDDPRVKLDLWAKAGHRGRGREGQKCREVRAGAKGKSRRYLLVKSGSSPPCCLKQRGSGTVSEDPGDVSPSLPLHPTVTLRLQDYLFSLLGARVQAKPVLGGLGRLLNVLESCPPSLWWGWDHKACSDSVVSAGSGAA